MGSYKEMASGMAGCKEAGRDSEHERMNTAFWEAVAYINAIPKFVGKNTMQDTISFYGKLGCPGKDARVIHVAGTNGKGSVCAYLQSVLMESGYVVGMFTSPHLLDIRERIRIDKELISEADFVRLFGQVSENCGGWACFGKDGMAQDGSARERIPQEYHPSYFEYLYFMAMLYFEEKKPDFIILETGLGGRLDATNSYPSPCISIITPIGFDHMEYLGDTLEKIAGEKAGIVKKGIPLVYFAKKKKVADVMEKAAKTKGSKAFPVSPKEISLQKCDEKGIDFSYYSGYYGCSMFHLPTRAYYQQENAALCIKALAVLQKQGKVDLAEEELQRGLEHAVWEGRMEEILPGMILDGAHNIDGIRAFLESVKGQTKLQENASFIGEAKSQKPILLYSALADKNYRDIINEIVSSGLFGEIVLAKMQDKRAESVGKLKELFPIENVVAFRDVSEAFGYCLKKRKNGYTVYMAGSLYLAGEIKKCLKEMQ